MRRTFKHEGNTMRFFAIIRVWHTLIGFQPVKRRSPTGCLVRHHTTDGPPKDLGGCPVVKRAMLRVGAHLFAPELCKLELVSEEGTRDVDILGAYADNTLSIQQLLCQNGCQATKHMPAAINNDLSLERHQPKSRVKTGRGAGKTAIVQP